MKRRDARSILVEVFCLLALACAMFSIGIDQGFPGGSIAHAEEKTHSPPIATGPRVVRPLRHSRSSPAKSEKPEKSAKSEVRGLAAEKAAPAPVDHHTLDSELSKETGIDVVMLLDSSGSMRRTDPQRLRDEGARLFIRFLTEADRLAIMQFDSEPRTLLDLANVNPKNLESIDKTVAGVSVEGRFTDLEAPVLQALELLISKGRPDAVKCIVLISDGTMDPHPQKGTAKQVTDKLFSIDLPRFKKHGVKLYTLALSTEADRDLLTRMAEEADGSSWYAADVNTIHRNFSDLFLALKKPQVVELDQNGFEIDPGIQEATFYLNRKGQTGEIEIIDPQGHEITNQNIPVGFRWFRGEMFDVITITSPLPGKWTVWGIDKPEGFATLLTEVNIQVHDFPSSINVGDKIQIVARLLAKGGALDVPGLADVLFFNYKIINADSSEVVAKGPLKDDGTDGDEKAGDKLYSTAVSIDTVGKFKAFITATSPTFTRQQQAPFTVFGLTLSKEGKPAVKTEALPNVEKAKEEKTKEEAPKEPEAPKETPRAPLPEETKQLILGICLILSSGAVVFGLWFFANRKVQSKKVAIEKVEAYVMPRELEKRLKELREKSSRQNHKNNTDDTGEKIAEALAVLQKGEAVTAPATDQAAAPAEAAADKAEAAPSAEQSASGQGTTPTETGKE